MRIVTIVVLLFLASCSKEDTPAPAPKPVCGIVERKGIDQSTGQYFLITSVTGARVFVNFLQYGDYNVGEKICFLNNKIVD